MPSFALERSLPPTEVTIELLRRLEAYVLSDVTRICRQTQERPVRSFSTTITDAFGTESLPSIDGYRPVMFPDSTSLISVECNTGWGYEPQIRVSLVFDREGRRSALKITVDGESPREKAMAIADGILRVLEPHRLSHAFLHVAFFGDFLRWMIGFFSAWLAAFAFADRRIELGAVMASIAILCFAHWFAARHLRPYTIFDSRISRRNAAFWKWFLYGSLGFVLFGTVLTFLRRRLFGF